MGRTVRFILALLAIAIAAAWWATIPRTLSESDLPDHSPNAAAGERIFWAGGCASCHATPVDGTRARGDDKLRLGGGLELETPFGLFRVPNISPHPVDGIGGWSTAEFVDAMQYGVSPDGRHYYPSFPYTSYARMRIEDVLDLKAYLDTLQPLAGRIADHELGFPWSIRRGIGLWKLGNLNTEDVVSVDVTNAAIVRGQDLVEGAGHCGECHTPRGAFGGLDLKRWLAGAPNPEGRGRVPNITPGGKNIGAWSAADITYYFETGLTPEFDTVGGSMVAVQENMARLAPADRQAIVAYLKALPAVD